MGLVIREPQQSFGCTLESLEKSDNRKPDDVYQSYLLEDISSILNS